MPTDAINAVLDGLMRAGQQGTQANSLSWPKRESDIELPPDPIQEAAFREWYARMARRYRLGPNPDDPQQFYDYRSAYAARAVPDATGHWPSQFKRPGHPNEVVGGFNTRTGERVRGTRRAGYAELVNLGWDPATAKRLAAMPEPR